VYLNETYNKHNFHYLLAYEILIYALLIREVQQIDGQAQLQGLFVFVCQLGWAF